MNIPERNSGHETSVPEDILALLRAGWHPFAFAFAPSRLRGSAFFFTSQRTCPDSVHAPIDASDGGYCPVSIRL